MWATKATISHVILIVKLAWRDSEWLWGICCAHTSREHRIHYKICTNNICLEFCRCNQYKYLAPKMYLMCLIMACISRQCCTHMECVGFLFNYSCAFTHISLCLHTPCVYIYIYIFIDEASTTHTLPIFS